MDKDIRYNNDKFGVPEYDRSEPTRSTVHFYCSLCNCQDCREVREQPPTRTGVKQEMNRLFDFTPPIMSEAEVNLRNERIRRLTEAARQEVNYENAAVNEFARKIFQAAPDDPMNYVLCVQESPTGKLYWFQHKEDCDLPKLATQPGSN